MTSATTTSPSDDARVAEAAAVDSRMNVLSLTEEQADYLEEAAAELATGGGPQAPGAAARARAAAQTLLNRLAASQRSVVSSFAAGDLPLLVVEGMHGPLYATPPELPPIEKLKTSSACMQLASRSQILLELAGLRAFAFDLDGNEMVRLVANFKGGGASKLREEPRIDKVELSSHAGFALGAHTEPPYYCSGLAAEGHSPAPSTLILTARWNPLNEPTTVVPIREVLEQLDAMHVLALTSRVYGFRRVDSHDAAKSEDGQGVSILDWCDDGTFSMRFSAYRFSVQEGAPPIFAMALDRLKAEIAKAKVVRVVLGPERAMIINNRICLHGRDVIKDNRRLLIRLFGYDPAAVPIILSDDPLLVQG